MEEEGVVVVLGAVAAARAGPTRAAGVSDDVRPNRIANDAISPCCMVMMLDLAVCKAKEI